MFATSLDANLLGGLQRRGIVTRASQRVNHAAVSPAAIISSQPSELVQPELPAEPWPVTVPAENAVDLIVPIAEPAPALVETVSTPIAVSINGPAAAGTTKAAFFATMVNAFQRGLRCIRSPTMTRKSISPQPVPTPLDRIPPASDVHHPTYDLDDDWPAAETINAEPASLMGGEEQKFSGGDVPPITTRDFEPDSLFDASDDDDDVCDDPAYDTLTMTLLHASPLVVNDVTNLSPGALESQAVSVAVLDASKELSELQHMIDRSGRPVELRFAHLNVETLGEALSTSIPDILHLSGHGALFPSGIFAMALERDTGSADFLFMERLKRLLATMEKTGRTPQLVFLSACYSETAARYFAEAGCKHIIACKSAERILDASARCFTHFFYASLLEGLSIRQAFLVAQGNVDVQMDPIHRETGRSGNTVYGTASMHLTTKESDKFVLLPLYGNHDEVVFPGDRVCGLPLPRVARSVSNSELSDDDDASSEDSFDSRPYSGRSSGRAHNSLAPSPSAPIPIPRLSTELAPNLDLDDGESRRIAKVSSAPAGQYYEMKYSASRRGPQTPRHTGSMSHRSRLQRSTSGLMPIRNTSRGQPLAAVRSFLPAPTEHMVGRQAEIQQTIGLLKKHRLVNIIGASHIGKTTVAKAAGHYLRERQHFKRGIVFVDMSSVHTLDDMCGKLLPLLWANDTQLPANAPHPSPAKEDRKRPGHGRRHSLPGLPSPLLTITDGTQKAPAPSPRKTKLSIIPPNLQQLMHVIQDWDCLLILDGCQPAEAPDYVIPLLTFTYSPRILITCTSPLSLPIESGFSQALVHILELSHHSCMELIAKVAPWFVSHDTDGSKRAAAERLVHDARRSAFTIRHELHRLDVLRVTNVSEGRSYC